MKDREIVVDIFYLKRCGLSERKIAERLGISRQTVHKYLTEPERVGTYVRTRKRSSKLDEYKKDIDALLDTDMGYQATWLYDQISAKGFSGSYDLVKRYVRKVKKERTRIAYMRFETIPGHQAQVDFGEFRVTQPDGRENKYYLFSMILGYSRKIYAELVEQCDQPTFLDCHIRAFEYFGGVPQEILYDRMKNVYIRTCSGTKSFNKTMLGFALHYRFKPLVAPPCAAWVKGKVERPYSFIREGFWRGYGFTTLVRANSDLLGWLQKKDHRIHGTTHETIVARFEREQPFLYPTARIHFDTSYRAYRKVHKDCTIQFECNRYVVSHHLVGQKLIVRAKNGRIRIFCDNRLHVMYTCPDGKGQLVQNPKFYQELRKDTEMMARKYHYSAPRKGRAKATISPTKARYEMDVQVRPLTYYEQFAYEETRT